MAAATYSWDIFLAHAGADATSAEAFYDLLSGGARVFLDSRCLLLGDDWDLELTRAQKTSCVTVVLVSTRTEAAYYERAEIAAAIAMARRAADRHRVVPVYLDGDADIPYGLELKHGLRISDEVPLQEAAARLLQLLEQLRQRSAAQAGDGAGTGETARSGLLHQPPVGWQSPVRRNRLRYKLAAFDFDGTLLRGPAFSFSWEAIWASLGFNERIRQDLRREYRQQTALDATRAARVRAYRKWCERACEHFMARGLTRDQLVDIVSPLKLTSNCREALREIRAQDTVIAIISGGIGAVLEAVFPDYRDHVDFVFMNDLIFDATGRLAGVQASEFDFQGKAEALQLVCERIGCTSQEAVFVGDHFNDEAVMLNVGKAIAYPPQDTVVSSIVHAEVVLDDLTAILPHVLVAD